MAIANTLFIRTSEGILFSQLLAGPVIRCLAWVVDLICILVLLYAVNFAVALIVLLSPDLAQALAILMYFAISIGYSIASEWYWRGQTPGKRIFRLRVVDAEGLRLHFSQIVIRNLLRFVDILPGAYLVGGLACLFSRRNQRLGDLAANTAVIRMPRIKEPDLAQILGGKYNSFRDHPHIEARLRQRVSAAEAGIALQAILRRDSLKPEARVELFAAMADHFKKLAPFPAEVAEGITDEQYVRNVLDVCYRSRKESLSTAYPEL